MPNLRNVLLLQLPIPPPGHVPVRGNVPLAAGYLKMLAAARGLEDHYRIEIFPSRLANELCDQALIAAILEREPWLVGFTCYLWNIERTLWIAEQLKARRPELFIVLGGPEITADNAWVLAHPAIDFACIGEGEQTFAELLAELRSCHILSRPIDGLFVAHKSVQGPSANLLAIGGQTVMPNFRKPLARLDEISSPYLAGILDAAEEQMLLLETIRGRVFKCKFCYYPKSYDSLYFLSRERLIANLEHAAQRGASEVVLLDPTLNQRRDFADFVRLLRDCNPGRQFTYFGELRAEGISTEIARLLREANFTEVEIGLQSVEPRAQELMDRTNNLRAFERGVRAMLDAGIKVKVDLIIGLPGDTVDSFRRGIDYLQRTGLYSSVQVFNLSILPGTAFRQEARDLGLEFQPRPPYYVTRTPTFELSEMLELMEEAQEAFGVEFDPLPPPQLELAADGELQRLVNLDLDLHNAAEPQPKSTGTPTLRLPSDGQEWPPYTMHVPDAHPTTQDSHCKPASHWLEQAGTLTSGTRATPRAGAFTLWLESSDFHTHRHAAAAAIERVLSNNPFTTLQVVLSPRGNPRAITPQCLERLTRACFENPSYLDKFYAVLPKRPKGAKRLVVTLPIAERARVDRDWIEAVGAFATLAWQGAAAEEVEFDEHEYALA